MNISIVTFNLRLDTRHDGENYFFNRAPYILNTILEKNPDIICFQEARRVSRMFSCILIAIRRIGIGL